MLNHLGIKKIIINVGTNDISVSLLPLMKCLEACCRYDQDQKSPQRLLMETLQSRKEVKET